jgi:hypothetical protein
MEVSLQGGLAARQVEAGDDYPFDGSGAQHFIAITIEAVRGLVK